MRGVATYPGAGASSDLAETRLARVKLAVSLDSREALEGGRAPLFRSRLPSSTEKKRTVWGQALNAAKSFVKEPNLDHVLQVVASSLTVLEQIKSRELDVYNPVVERAWREIRSWHSSIVLRQSAGEKSVEDVRADEKVRRTVGLRVRIPEDGLSNNFSTVTHGGPRSVDETPVPYIGGAVRDTDHLESRGEVFGYDSFEVCRLPAEENSEVRASVIASELIVTPEAFGFAECLHPIENGIVATEVKGRGGAHPFEPRAVLTRYVWAAVVAFESRAFTHVAMSRSEHIGTEGSEAIAWNSSSASLSVSDG
jgi:hypothetical protein